MAVGLVPMGWVPTRLCELPMTCSAALRREPQLGGRAAPEVVLNPHNLPSKYTLAPSEHNSVNARMIRSRQNFSQQTRRHCLSQEAERGTTKSDNVCDQIRSPSGLPGGTCCALLIG
jgi:hypothetical protein